MIPNPAGTRRQQRKETGMRDEDDEQLPGIAGEIADDYPEVWDAYSDLGAAVAGAGPLTSREMRLVKLALAIGIQSEGAVHSHARRARDEGIGDEDLRQVALLSIPTHGFPRAAAAISWLSDDDDEDDDDES
jgi:alkylhydroperoxidase/carboxymuconolactone decarboxylase family protein YurZ